MLWLMRTTGEKSKLAVYANCRIHQANSEDHQSPLLISTAIPLLERIILLVRGRCNMRLPMQPPTSQPFSIDGFLAAVRAQKKIVHFRRKQTIFSQGERSDAMFYIEKGNVKLTVASRDGKEAIIGVFDGGTFFGESCIASDRPARFHTAIALTDVRVVKIDRKAIINTLRATSDAFYECISSLLRRNARVQQDFANNLLETGDKRLARALLSISRLKEGQSPPFSKITQQEWANMIGITRQRVNVLLRQFKESGFIDDAVGLRVNPSISFVLREGLGRRFR